jgi:GGDEF domain-containing protein
MPFICYGLAGRIGRKWRSGHYFLEAIAISVGVAVWQKDFLSQDDLMAAASALYEAKEAERNRERTLLARRFFPKTRASRISD